MVYGSGVTIGSFAGLISSGKALLNMSPNSQGAGGLKVIFGQNANQQYHTWRHIVDELGMDKNIVQQAIEADLQTTASQIIPGKPFNGIVTVGGKRLQYTAFIRPDGTINIGRIHGI